MKTSGPQATAARNGASPDGLPPLREVIAAHNLAAKKALGQNFLLDLNITRKIARALGPAGRGTVVEVGPGPGGLTRALLVEEAERVIAIERDERCRGALAEIAARYPGRLDVVFGDAVAFDWTKRIENVSPPVSIAANLPYAIATLLLTGWLEAEPWPPWYDRMVLMFQREVGERIVAAPGSKSYGRLSVLSQWRCAVRIVMTLPPEAFTPPPKVASAVVEFLPRPKLEPQCSAQILARVTAAAFGQRRKMLRQSLKSLVAMPELLLAEADIDPALRAENLSVAEFAKIAALLSSSAGHR